MMNQTTVAVRPATESDATSISTLLAELGYPLEVADVQENIARLSSSSSDAVLVAEAAFSCYWQPGSHQFFGGEFPMAAVRYRPEITTSGRSVWLVSRLSPN